MTAPARNKFPGFTLIEVLIGSSLAAFAMMALLSGFVFLARNFTRLTNLQSLEGQSRTALAYLQSDLTLARKVKSGTTASASAVTLVLPAGEVSYTYDSTTGRLKREAGFGSQPELFLLTAPNCRCTTFAFSYATGSNGSPVDQVSAVTNTPYSIKQLQVSFVLQTPTTAPEQTRVSYRTVSPWLNLRNRGAPDGN